MLKESEWRLLRTGALTGPENMAIDEAVALAHARGGVPPTLRFYTWQPAAVTIGYFQSMAGEVNLDAVRAGGFGYVRRPTGGRAIFHHTELTYSVSVRENVLPGTVLETYKFLAQGLLAGLRRLGVPAAIAAGEPDPRSFGGEANPSCFDTPSASELVVDGRKVVGSAQTRREGAILQHGSILLDLDYGLLFSLLRVPDPAAAARHLRKRAAGLQEVLGRAVPVAAAEVAMAAGFAEALGLQLTPGTLTPAEQAEADRLLREKYGNDDWNLRK